MDERVRFVARLLDGEKMAPLCAEFGISRKTGYRLVERYLQQGAAGLQELSRRPHSSPNETAAHIVEALLEARRHHPRWGAKKLIPLVEKRHPSWDLPGRSTVCDILKRHGMVPKKRRRRTIGHPGRPTSRVLAPNDLWCADFKGEFKTGDGIYCYPLTVTDDHSRYLLGCQGLLSTKVAEAKPVFTRLFKEYGLPKRIRTDNGVPFATNTLRGYRSSRPGGYGLGCCQSSSNQANRSRTGVTNACTAPSRPRRLGRLLGAAVRSSASSTVSATSSTRSGRTRRLINRPRPPATRARRGRCRTSSRRSSTPTASRCAR